MSSYTSIQGSFRVTADATIRLTDDPGGTPTNSDFAVTAGTVYDSVEALIQAWEDQVVADIPGYVIAHRRGTTGACWLTISSVAAGGNTFDVTWSQSGNGVDLRDWLGQSADLSGAGPSYSDSSKTIPAMFSTSLSSGFVWDAPRARRGTTSRMHARAVALDGSQWHQANPDVSAQDDATGDVVIQFTHASTVAGSHQMIGELESCVIAMWDEDGAVPGRFALYDGDAGEWICRFDESPVITVRRRDDSVLIWEARLPCSIEVAAW